MQRRILSLLVGITFVGVLAATGAWAGSPHFVGSCTIVSQSGTCVTVAGKEAGLGDEEQITVVLTATAQCINPGSHHPQAANKADIAAGADVPVQNGKANYTIQGCAEFQPECSPPMTVVLSDITVTDVTNNISLSCP
jgi:hypothetical protein